MKTISGSGLERRRIGVVVRYCGQGGGCEVEVIRCPECTTLLKGNVLYNSPLPVVGEKGDTT